MALPLNDAQRVEVLRAYGQYGHARRLEEGECDETDERVVEALEDIERDVDAAVEAHRHGGMGHIDTLRHPAVQAIARTRVADLGPHPGVAFVTHDGGAA